MKSDLPVSYLFVPASRCERIAKAVAAGAQAVIVDLEDAVDPAHKAEARAQLESYLRTGALKPWLRINALGTPWFDDDMALVAQSGAQLAGVMLPKTESQQDLAQIQARTPLPLIALVESARGMTKLADIGSHPDLHRMAFGSADLARDLGCEDSWDSLSHARQAMVLHSAACGLPAPIDGVSFVLDQAGPVREDAARAARHGFGAKLCIHPAQIAATHEGFAPSAAQLQWAQAVLAAATQGSGAQRVGGQMIDRPVIERARQILARQPTSNSE
ncbi:MAG: CoA ester lyase [Betaproteobacteria bacterium]